MQPLTITAASLESALGFHAAHSDFRSVIVEKEDGRCDVEILLGRGGDRENIGVLNTIELYVSRRASGPALIEMGGHSYVLHALPEADEAEANDRPAAEHLGRFNDSPAPDESGEIRPLRYCATWRWLSLRS